MSSQGDNEVAENEIERYLRPRKHFHCSKENKRLDIVELLPHSYWASIMGSATVGWSRRTERNHFAFIGIEAHGSQHLRGRRRGAVAVVLFYARRTVNLFGGKIPAPIEDQEAGPSIHTISSRALPPLELTKHLSERRTQGLGLDRIEYLAHRCLDETTWVALILTSGARHAAPVCDRIWDEQPELPALAYAALEKAYDSDHSRARMAADGAQAVIPPTANRLKPMAFDAVYSMMEIWQHDDNASDTSYRQWRTV